VQRRPTWRGLKEDCLWRQKEKEKHLKVADFLHRINGNCQKLVGERWHVRFPKRSGNGTRGAEIIVPWHGEISQGRKGSLNRAGYRSGEKQAPSSRIIRANLQRKASRVPAGEIDVELDRQAPRRTTASSLHPPKPNATDRRRPAPALARPANAGAAAGSSGGSTARHAPTPANRPAACSRATPPQNQNAG